MSSLAIVPRCRALPALLAGLALAVSAVGPSPARAAWPGGRGPHPSLSAASSAAVVPDPPPAWTELVPRTREQRLLFLSELVGQFWEWTGEPVYVWDVAAVRHPGGGVAILRLVIERPDGSLVSIVTDLSEHPAGSVELRWLDDFYADAGPTFWWSDESGEVHATSMAADLTLGPLAPGGGYRFPSLDSCLLHGTFICLPTAACEGGPCDAVNDGCWCGVHRCYMFPWAFCQGSCGMGQSCRHPTGSGGCSCQDL